MRRTRHGVTDMVLQPDYPEFNGRNGKETLREVYLHDPALPFTLPAYGEAYFNPGLGEYIDLTRLTLAERTVRMTPGGNLEISLTWGGDDPVYSESDRVIYDECELDGDEEDVPLEKLDNYRTHWNYRLLSISPIMMGPELPFFYNAKDTVIPETYREGWKWIKPGDQVPDGWYEYRSESKPGVENKLGGTHTVIRTRRALSKRAFELDMTRDLTITPPPDTFALQGEWLRGVTRIRREGEFWTATNRYFNALVIDRDLYKLAAAGPKKGI